MIKCKPNSPSCKTDSASHTSPPGVYLNPGINTVYLCLFCCFSTQQMEFNTIRLRKKATEKTNTSRDEAVNRTRLRWAGYWGYQFLSNSCNIFKDMVEMVNNMHWRTRNVSRELEIIKINGNAWNKKHNRWKFLTGSLLEWTHLRKDSSNLKIRKQRRQKENKNCKN